MGEQPNPWDRLQPQVAMSRHRGAKPPRRCELLGEFARLRYLLGGDRPSQTAHLKLSPAPIRGQG